MGFLHSLLLTGYGWREENDFWSHFKPTETVTTVVGCLLWARWHFTYSSEGMNHHFQFRPVRSHPPAIVVIFVAVCSRQNSIPIHLRSVLAWKTIIFTDFSISFHPISSCSCSFVGIFHVDVSVSVERCLLNSHPYESSVSSHISMDCWLLRIQFEFERSASHSVLTWFTICVDFGLVFLVSRVFSEFNSLMHAPQFTNCSHSSNKLAVRAKFFFLYFFCLRVLCFLPPRLNDENLFICFHYKLLNLPRSARKTLRRLRSGRKRVWAEKNIYTENKK